MEKQFIEPDCGIINFVESMPCVKLVLLNLLLKMELFYFLKNIIQNLMAEKRLHHFIIKINSFLSIIQTIDNFNNNPNQNYQFTLTVSS